MDRPQRQLPPRRCAAKPSFSSTLLDAIYRSIDNDDDHTVRAQDTSPLHALLTKKQASTTATLPAETRKPSKPALRHKHRHRVYSSPDCSEPMQHGLRPIRTRTAPLPPQKQESKTVDKRLEDLRTPKIPASPGARLSRFLNSLFSKKAAEEPLQCSTARACLNKTTSLTQRKGSETCRTASSYARSCMNKTMSMNAGDRKKIVRFEPVSSAVASPARKGGVEEWESDSSSDLFELEELKRGIRGGGERFRDELPVYKSTNVGRLRRGL